MLPICRVERGHIKQTTVAINNKLCLSLRVHHSTNQKLLTMTVHSTTVSKVLEKIGRATAQGKRFEVASVTVTRFLPPFGRKSDPIYFPSDPNSLEPTFSSRNRPKSWVGLPTTEIGRLRPPMWLFPTARVGRFLPHDAVDAYQTRLVRCLSYTS